LTHEHLLLLGSTVNSTKLEERLANLVRDHSVVQCDMTSGYAGLYLIGPNAEAVLRKLTSVDVSASALPVGSCAETSLAGVHALLVPTLEDSLPAVRVYVAWDVGEYVWDQLFRLGRDFGITPVGLESIARLSSTATNLA
jgi:4-methylaminobutanoate oxidase (formaldehyde-forming)